MDPTILLMDPRDIAHESARSHFRHKKVKGKQVLVHYAHDRGQAVEIFHTNPIGVVATSLHCVQNIVRLDEYLMAFRIPERYVPILGYGDDEIVREYAMLLDAAISLRYQLTPRSIETIAIQLLEEPEKYRDSPFTSFKPKRERRIGHLISDWYLDDRRYGTTRQGGRR